jgi:putative phage-type endonuclease
VLGLCPYKSAVELWSELVSGEAEREHDQLHLRFGHFAETFVAREYERSSGLFTVPHPQTIFHRQYGFMYGHVDRFVLDTPDTPAVVDGVVTADRILECKTASAFTRGSWGETGTDQVPPAYLLQCAWYMAVTGCSCVDLAALIGNSELRIFSIKRDAQLESLIMLHAQRFWMDHVLTQSPPEPTSSKDAAILFPEESAGMCVDASPLIMSQVEQYRKLCERSERLSQECERIRAEILAYMAGAEMLTHRGRVLATWKCAKSSQRLDSKSMAAAHPEIAKEFTSTVLGSRRFLLKDLPKEVPQPQNLAQQDLMAPLDSIALSVAGNSLGQGTAFSGASLS